MSSRKPIPKRIIVQVLIRDGYRCWYCGDLIPTIYIPVLDHQHPYSRGGANTADNLVVSCGGCNGRKRAMDVEEFRSYLERLGRVRGVQFYGEGERCFEKLRFVQLVVKWPNIVELAGHAEPPASNT
jgi:hypothetical protein